MDKPIKILALTPLSSLGAGLGPISVEETFEVGFKYTIFNLDWNFDDNYKVFILIVSCKVCGFHQLVKCFGSGSKFAASISVPRRGFMVGEQVPATVVVHAGKNKRNQMKQIRLNLVQEVHYRLISM